MREILDGAAAVPEVARITPAYAGNTRRAPLVRLGFWDHPRLCGKYFSPFDVNRILRGSPPPMREIPPLAALFSPFDGITPAYAGNTYRNRLRLCFLWDHPRLCGKYVVNLTKP